MNIECSGDLEQIYLAFDIHDVLAKSKADKNSAPLFQAYGMLLQVSVEGYSQPIRHYIYPFAKEFFRLLAETPGVQFAFFTSSQENFAKPFVRELLINSLGQEEYAKIADKVSICAKKQLRANDSYKEIERNLSSKYGTYGSYRKDLDDVYPSLDIPKKQRVLIEDDSSYAAPHQFKNLLNVSGCYWAEEIGRFQEAGYGLYFFSSYEEFDKKKSCIEPRKSLALSVKQGINKESTQQAFVIIYHDKEGQKELELSAEESIKIKELYEKSVFESISSICEDYPFQDSEKKIVAEIYKTGLDTRSNSVKDRMIFLCGKEVSPELCVKKALGGDIAIYLGECDANIYFPENPEAAISLKNHGSFKLIRLATEYWESQCKNKDFFSKESDKQSAQAQLYDIIWDKVKAVIWKEQLIPTANHILLLTGAIFSAWEESKTTQKPISKILFNWQCDNKRDSKPFTPKILQKRTELYLKGLELLRKVNPDLEPITIKSFEYALEKYPSLPDDGAIEDEDGCVIS